jgi:multicomponent Na+:H+ antiporter subunit E
VLEKSQILLFTALAFWLLLDRLHAKAKVSLDTDWLYRGLPTLARGRRTGHGPTGSTSGATPTGTVITATPLSALVAVRRRALVLLRAERGPHRPDVDARRRGAAHLPHHPDREPDAMNRARPILLFVALLAFWTLLSGKTGPALPRHGRRLRPGRDALRCPAADGGARLPEDTPTVDLLRLAAYIGWLLTRIPSAAVDVALSILLPSRGPKPGVVRFTTGLHSPAARTLLANSITLVPGTMTLSVDGGEFVVHALSPRPRRPSRAPRCSGASPASSVPNRTHLRRCAGTRCAPSSRRSHDDRARLSGLDPFLVADDRHRLLIGAGLLRVMRDRRSSTGSSLSRSSR